MTISVIKKTIPLWHSGKAPNCKYDGYGLASHAISQKKLNYLFLPINQQIITHVVIFTH